MTGVAAARIAALRALVAGLAALLGCGAAERTLHLEGRALGTSWKVELVLSGAAESARPADVRERIAAVLERVDRGMSTWRPDSGIVRFNRSPRKTPAVLTPETRRVVASALALARETGGAFDPTVGPLVALWGFGAGAATREPGEAELARTRARVGWQHLAWNAEGLLVRQVPGVELDLSAIAKGYAVDALVAELAALRPEGLLVEIGGEVRGFGTKPGGAPWRVGIQHPAAEGVLEVVALGGAALATSGEYRQQRRVDDRRIGHVIDPRSGRPVETGVASASVIAPTCMEADAVATALMVLGAEAALAWVEERPWLEALLLVRDRGAALERRPSSGWSRWSVPPR